MHGSHQRALTALERRGRLRQLAARSGIDFSSNDYLGLGASQDMRDAIAAALLRGVAVGAGGSRLLRGNDPEHEALEQEAAQHFGAESVLYFGGGFVANYAVLATLPQRGDLIAYDQLVHASALDGIAASKAASLSFRHNDVQALDAVLSGWRTSGGSGRVWIAIESLYSMDGDRAPLDDFAALASRHDAMLLIDEAHATGVYGEHGRGLAAHLEGQENIVSLHTCGKALGVSGALVLGPARLRDFLINRSRAFIYATAPSPLMAAATRAALDLCRRDSSRRDQLYSQIAVFGQLLKERCEIEPSGTQIQPVIVGSDARATGLASALQASGFDIRAVRPPTVPEGTARLRVSITLNATENDIDRMTAALATELKRMPA